jgi:hypothetical protein
MRKFKFELLILFLINLSIASLAQDDHLSESIKSILEELADNETDPEAGTEYTERLHELSEKPVNLNSADESELSRLFFLTDFQIKSIADYVHSSGKIFTVYEIMNIPGFNRDIAEMIIPFIKLDARGRQISDTTHLMSSILVNFLAKHPESEPSAVGPPWKGLIRYRLNAGKITAGLTSEKDYGEKLFSGRPSLPDFISANIAFEGNGVLRRIIVGDFSGRFGLGTNINTGLSTGLSLTAAGYLSGGDEIRPFTSSDENNFFRGIAFSLKIKKLGITGFLSGNKIDATVDTSAGNNKPAIETFYRSGLHNSITSLSKKDAVTEDAAGISANCDLNNLKLGIILSGNKFSIPVKKHNDDPETLYDFEGNRNWVLSSWYKMVVGKVILFGEVSSDYRFRFAWIQGASFRPADRLTINLLYRSYEPGFTSFHGKGPFSSSSGDNLRGIFGNFTFETAKYLFLSGGYDLRWYPWLRYRCSAPSVARSSEVRLRYQPAGKFSAEMTYDYRVSVYDDPETTGIKKQLEFKSYSVKGTLKFSPLENLIFTSRFDYKTAGPVASHGVVLLQDISLRFRKIPVTLWLRHAVFNTDDWNSRIYAYENDLPGTFNIPALSGKGSRSCIMIAWKKNNWGELRIKYGVLSQIKDGVNVNNEEVKIQIRFYFH